jgi:sugar phosphate isomerase/epimerase
MTQFSLGINNCFAVKRWPEPDAWARLIANELGLGIVQHSFDLSELNVSDEDQAIDVAEINAACAAHGLVMDSTFTGLGAYSSNLLLAPSERGHSQALQWYAKAIEFTQLLGAKRTGGHVGAFSVSDYRDPKRRELLQRRLVSDLEILSRQAKSDGLSELLVENLAAAREPSTMQQITALVRDADADHAAIKLCLDVGHQCVVGTAGAERDPYAWLRRMGRVAPVVQLQQSDAAADHHWPFTDQTNALGRIEANAVLQALVDSGADEVVLILEIVPAFEADDDEVLSDLVSSAAYWRSALDM